MNELAAALLAAGVAFLVNRGGIRKIGIAEVVWIGPVIEELGKTGIAMILGASIVPTHAFFGLLEAIWDIWAGTAHRYAAAFVSIFGHGVFGYVTMWGYAYFSSWWGGVATGIAVHIFWNSYVVIFLVKHAREKGGKL